MYMWVRIQMYWQNDVRKFAQHLAQVKPCELKQAKNAKSSKNNNNNNNKQFGNKYEEMFLFGNSSCIAALRIGSLFTFVFR